MGLLVDVVGNMGLLLESSTTTLTLLLVDIVGELLGRLLPGISAAKTAGDTTSCELLVGGGSATLEDPYRGLLEHGHLHNKKENGLVV